MKQKSSWEELKELAKISTAILILIWKYKTWKEKKKLEANNIHYQKQF